MGEKFETNFPRENQEKGKLTIEKVREMVKKFKKERGGLLPHLFGIPGEEREEEKEYPEELLIAHKLKKYLEEEKIGKIYPEIEADEKFKNSTIEKEMQNETLQENALQDEINYINEGQKPGKTWSARWAFRSYHSLKSSGFWPEMKDRFKEKCDEIEKEMKNEILQENALQEVIDDINKGQQSGEIGSAWTTFQGYHFLKSSGSWQEMKDKFPKECERIEEGMKNEILQENALQYEINYINEGQKPNTWSAWRAFQGYHSLKSSGSWPEMERNEKLKEKCERIEEGMKNEILQKNALQYEINNINKAQQLGAALSAWGAFRGYSSLRFFVSDLEEIGKEKEKQKELEKAIHPQKNIPPRPEARSF